jgi:hypothetical protein
MIGGREPVCQRPSNLIAQGGPPSRMRVFVSAHYDGAQAHLPTFLRTRAFGQRARSLANFVSLLTFDPVAQLVEQRTFNQKS